MTTFHFYTKDHPEANGRTPQSGEHAYSYRFPLANGHEIVMHCGDETMGKFAESIGSMTIDDASEGAANPVRHETNEIGVVEPRGEPK